MNNDTQIIINSCFLLPKIGDGNRQPADTLTLSLVTQACFINDVEPFAVRQEPVFATSSDGHLLF